MWEVVKSQLGLRVIEFGATWITPAAKLNTVIKTFIKAILFFCKNGLASDLVADDSGY